MALPTRLPHISDAATDSNNRLTPHFYNALQQALSNIQAQVSQLGVVTDAVTDPGTGDIAQVASDLAALNLAVGSLKYLANDGMVSKAGSVYSARTLQDTTTIAWTNPDGVAGDPSADFIGTTDDVPEGAINLYYTDTRARTAAIAPTLVQTGETFLVPDNKQVLFSLPITVDGTLQVDGYLVEV